MNRTILVLLCTLLPIGAVNAADIDSLGVTAGEQSKEESARDVTQIRLERKLAEKEIAKLELEQERIRLEREGLNPEVLKVRISELEKQLQQATDRAVRAEKAAADLRGANAAKEREEAPADFSNAVALTRILVNGNVERARVIAAGISREVTVGDEVEKGVFVKAISKDSMILDKAGKLKTVFLSTGSAAVATEKVVSTPFGTPPAAPVINR